MDPLSQDTKEEGRLIMCLNPNLSHMGSLGGMERKGSCKHERNGIYYIRS